MDLSMKKIYLLTLILFLPSFHMIAMNRGTTITTTSSRTNNHQPPTTVKKSRRKKQRTEKLIHTFYCYWCNDLYEKDNGSNSETHNENVHGICNDDFDYQLLIGNIFIYTSYDDNSDTYS